MIQLDGWLQKLEDAAERGETRVSARLAQNVGRGLPCIAAGMPITEALEAVFQKQEIVLSKRSNPVGRGSDPGTRLSGTPSLGEAPPRLQLVDEPNSPLDARAARVLTKRIKTEINNVCLLLSEAHDRRAWVVLGHSTWNQYVRKEFGYSRSRSYEILDQARVVQAIQRAAGSDSIPDLSAYTARQIKPYLQKIVNEIRDRVAAASTRTDHDEIVREIVGAARSIAASTDRHASPVAATNSREIGSETGRFGVECGKVFAALDFVANLPAPEGEFLVALTNERQQLRSLRPAIDWLLTLAQCTELLMTSAESAGESHRIMAAGRRISARASPAVHG
jgi:hypothetical protein